jgi:hypothetical protein
MDTSGFPSGLFDPATVRRGRDTVPFDLFECLSAWLAGRTGWTVVYAGRAVDQTLAFLHAQMSYIDTGAPLVPSAKVRQGWEAFVLHTMAYRSYCQQSLGRFLHYAPLRADRVVTDSQVAQIALGRTMGKIRVARFHVDPAMWDRPA